METLVVTTSPGADPDQVRRALVAHGLWVSSLTGGDRPHFLVEPHSAAADRGALLRIEGVEAVLAAASGHPLLDAQPAVVAVGPVKLGPGRAPVFMAGPCSVESEGQIRAAAGRLAALGVSFLRGGAFKPRTSPYAFQGHGVRALGWLRAAASDAGMMVVTEALGAEDVSPVAEVADLVQVGSRNMYNYALLRSVARTRKPVLLKRGMSATISEWLSAGEYCLLHGAAAVILCERGIRSFDPSTRNLLDLGAVALLAHARGMPVIVDPSHGVGRRDLIPPLSRAALAAGACGLMLETHDDPGSALSDGPQALLPQELGALLGELRPPPARQAREEGPHV